MDKSKNSNENSPTPLSVPNSEMTREATDAICVARPIRRTKTTIKSYKCEECDQFFSRDHHLDRHKLIHTGIRPYKCTVCQKDFTRNYHLIRHMYTHPGEKPATTAICVARPIRSCRTTKTTGLSPTQSRCGSKTATTRRPTTIKSHKCKECGDYFTPSYFNRHKLTHTGIRPYKCTVCRKKFARDYHLDRHMSTHTGEKPYSCEICAKAFSRTDKLKKHTLTHSL